VDKYIDVSYTYVWGPDRVNFHRRGLPRGIFFTCYIRAVISNPARVVALKTKYDPFPAYVPRYVNM
jgi:hypothetical protein